MNRICIVDDNVAVCDSLRFLFEISFNIKASIYNDPISFLQDFNSLWKGCLIIDLSMPGMSGYDVIKQVKIINSKAQIISISGHATVEAGERALAAGASAFIIKPFNTQDLFVTVKEMLKNAQNTNPNIPQNVE